MNFKNMLDEFEERYPWLAKHGIEYWEEINYNLLLVTLGDGRSYIYNNSRKVKNAKLVKLFDNPDDLTDDEWMRGFSYNLRCKLKENDIHQYEFAEQIGVGRNMMNLYCTGKSIPSSRIFDKMTRVLKCDASDLVPHDYVFLE